MKYVLINWSYNKPGKWMSICSTDLDAAKEISGLVCSYIKSYKRVKLNGINPDGGRATIEDIETDAQAGDINRFLSDFFTTNGWKGQADKREIYSYSKVS